ncbi:hypothetical protein Agub_g6868, partial [Astrephomene gubernaculifera]
MQLDRQLLGSPCKLSVAPRLQPQPLRQWQRSCRTQALRSKGRDGRGPGAGQGASLSSSWVLPTSLVSERRAKDGDLTSDSAASSEPLTVYTIRLTTSPARGSALSDPYAAVNVCLIGESGRGALLRISQVNDPLESRAHTLEMCQLIGPEVGADCSLAVEEGADAPFPAPAAAPRGGAGAAASTASSSQPHPQQSANGAAATSSGSISNSSNGSSSSSSSLGAGGTRRNLVGRPPPPPPPKRRFQEGSVDEVSLLVPELGPLSGLLVGVEGGSWGLQEADVVSSRTRHMDRFVCRRLLGARAGEGAALLPPVPAGAVVYGEGEAAVVLSQDQASALRSLGLAHYSALKRRLAAATALLVATGGCLAALTGGAAAAMPYTAGGVVGLVYQWLLMRGVDHVMEAASASASASTAQQQQQLQPPPQHGAAAAPHDSSTPSSSSNSDSTPNPSVNTMHGSSAATEQQHQHQHQQEEVAPVVASVQNPEPSASATAAQAAEASIPGGSGGLGGAAGRLLGAAPLRLGLVCLSAAMGLAMLARQEAVTGGVAGGLSLVGPLDASSLFSSPATTSATATTVTTATVAPLTTVAPTNPTAAWQLALGALGFMTYKVAMVGVVMGDDAAGG